MHISCRVAHVVGDATSWLRVPAGSCGLTSVAHSREWLQPPGCIPIALVPAYCRGHSGLERTYSGFLIRWQHISPKHDLCPCSRLEPGVGHRRRCYAWLILESVLHIGNGGCLGFGVFPHRTYSDGQSCQPVACACHGVHDCRGYQFFAHLAMALVCGSGIAV